MKDLIRYTFLVLILSSFQVQAQQWSDVEMAAYKLAYKEAREHFLEGKYDQYVTYFESIKTFAGIPKFEGLKMASESYEKLARSQGIEKVYQQAVRHFGKMVVDENWDRFVVGVSDPNPVKDAVDEPASYPEGMAAFYAYVHDELKYPKDAMGKGIEGNVFVQLIVNKDGSLDGIQAVKGIGYGCDAEAVRVIKNAQRFIPGKQDGEAVPTLMMLPIIFRVSKGIK
ncbi:MAG: energy transducer TonB [Cytophagales bacterium]|nr:energy transducer TonB [Cytophagales bacterium]